VLYDNVFYNRESVYDKLVHNFDLVMVIYALLLMYAVVHCEFICTAYLH
jgi:hypothetical protein